MKKTILIGLAFVSVFTACKKNDDNGGTPVAQKKYLSRDIWQLTDTTDYSYDANKVLVKTSEYGSGGPFNTILDYQNGKLSTINLVQGTVAPQLNETYVYDGSGRVQKVIFADGYQIDSITYNSNGTINKTYSFSRYYDITVPYQVTLYIWGSSGNIDTIKQAVDDKSLANNCDKITTCYYDNKVNPWYYLPVFYDINELDAPSFISKNNLIKDVYQARSGGVLKEQEVREFNYTYDSDGYPASYIVNFRQTQNDPVDQTRQGKYEYSK